MATDKLNQIFNLQNGRKLGYAEYGDPNGKVVFHFHGSGGSRLEYPIDETILTNLKIRLISIDRPGHGFSDPHPNRKLLDFPDDILELAGHLKIDKFFVQGWSAGGPYALACAYKLSNRILAGAIISGTAPPNRPQSYKGLPLSHKLIMFVIRNFPKVMYSMRKGMYKAVALEDNILAKNLISSFPDEDKLIFNNSIYQAQFIADIREGYKQGWEGPAQDDIVIINQPWGFKLENIKPRIDIWQGKQDKNVPFNHGVFQNKVIPNSRLIVLENEAHLYLFKEWKNVLSKLIEDKNI